MIRFQLVGNVQKFFDFLTTWKCFKDDGRAASPLHSELA